MDSKTNILIFDGGVYMEKKEIQKEEKKEKRSKKKLLLLLLLLILTGVLLSTSTYAWFTSNRTVTVEDINVNVAASSGIQISTDAIEWKSIITNADITNAHTTYGAATNQIPGTLRPVSTAAKTLANGYLSMWLGTVSTSETTVNKGKYILSTQDVSTVKDNSDSTAISGSNTGAFGNFVMFDLFIRLDDSTSAASTAQKLYLTTGSNVVNQTGSTDLGTQNSARVAFINEGVASTGAAASSIQALSTTDASNVIVWEPNYDAHTPTGLSNAYSYYNDANSGEQYDKATTTPAIQVPYFGTIGAVAVADDVLLSKANATDNAAKFASITPSLATKADWTTGHDYEELISMLPNNVVKLRIYFWIEGQDIDCENHASGGNITLKLQFSLDENDGTVETEPEPEP